jgi:hypothetical protein
LQGKKSPFQAIFGGFMCEAQQTARAPVKQKTYRRHTSRPVAPLAMRHYHCLQPYLGGKTHRDPMTPGSLNQTAGIPDNTECA